MRKLLTTVGLTVAAVLTLGAVALGSSPASAHPCGTLPTDVCTTPTVTPTAVPTVTVTVPGPTVTVTKTVYSCPPPCPALTKGAVKPKHPC